MEAASESARRGATATSPVRLRVDVFDRLAEEMNATSETAKAELMETDRKTLWRFREGETTPKLDLAMRWAERLNVKVEDLWERAA